MQLKLAALNAAAAKKGFVMKIYNKKNHLSRILIFFIMLLFAVGLSLNVLFCSNYTLCESLSNITAIETRAIAESTVSNEDGDVTPHSNTSFLSKNNSPVKALTKNICPIPVIAAIPKGFSLLLFLITVFLFYFSALFILLPDERTLINQKVRLDD